MNPLELPASSDLTSAFHAEHIALSVHKTETERAICRKYSKLLREEAPEYVLDFARVLLFSHAHRWQAYEIIAAQPVHSSPES